MYYEEKIIDGVLHWRNQPDGEWQPINYAGLLQKYKSAKARAGEEKAARERAEERITRLQRGNTALLEALIAKARELADTWGKLAEAEFEAGEDSEYEWVRERHYGRSQGHRQCADELNAALAQPAQEVERE